MAAELGTEPGTFQCPLKSAGKPLSLISQTVSWNNQMIPQCYEVGEECGLGSN